MKMSDAMAALTDGAVADVTEVTRPTQHGTTPAAPNTQVRQQRGTTLG